MTRRDGDLSSKMPHMDKGEYSHQNSTGILEKGQDLVDGDAKPKLTVATHSTKHSSSSSRHTSTSGNGSDGYSFFRDSSRSLPGSRAGSRPGSRPGSRIHSRTNSQESIIDLFDCMTLTYGHNKSTDGQKGIQLVPGKGIQFLSPKPKQFRNERWTWHDKVRINSAIWRAWHMQYIKGKKPVVCHFTAPVLEKSRLNPDVIQAGRGYTGSIHWNQSRVDNIVSHYRKWRVKAKDALQPQSQAYSGAVPEEELQDPEENALDLDMPHPPHSPMFARKLANDDMPLKDFSDTLFISTGKRFNVPHPKKITQHVYNADIIQPGLMQLEPDFDDDFMDTLESLTDILMKTPTKSELQSFNVSADFPTCFLESDSLMETMDLGLQGLQGAERVLQSNINLQTSNIFPVSIQPSTPHYVRNLDFTTQKSTQQQQQLQQQLLQQQQQQQQQQLFHQTSGVYVTTNPLTSTYVVSGQQPLIQSTASQPTRTGFIPLTEVANRATQGSSNIAIGFQPNVAIQQQQQPNPSLMQALTGDYNITLPQMTSTGGYQAVGNIGAVSNITPVVSTATHPSHSVSKSFSKVEPLSPTPSNRPACEVMGVINEAIDVLAYQLPMSPSRMIPPICTGEWSGTTAAPSAVTMQWTVAENTPATNIVPAPVATMPMVSTSQGLVATMPVVSTSQGLVPMNQKPFYNIGEPSQRRSRGQGGVEDSMEMEAESPASSSNSGSVTPSGARTPSGAVTPPTKTNKRDRDGNFSRSNSTSPRTSFASLYPDSSLHAALARKSDVKELGMLSPSSTADREGAFVSSASYPSTAASSAASSPGTPHNEMADAAQREFEFPTQKPKRLKTPDSSDRVEKETRRRLKHLKSEHKRRFNIQTGLDEMQAIVPALNNTPEGVKISTATLLVKAHEHITTLKEDFSDMRKNGEELKNEIEKLNNEIEKCQDELPDSGAPVNPRNDRQLQAMLDAYVTERSSANWKFWIFSLIVRPLFETYLNAVCDNPSTDFDTAVTEWIEEHCRLRALRTVVLSALRQVSKRTSVLADPSKLPDQVNDIVTKECTSTSEKT